MFAAPAAFYVISIVVIWFYPINRAQLAKIIEGVAEMKLGKCVKDPLYSQVIQGSTCLGKIL